ncbi:MAG: flagellar basal body rod protein FlgC [bacterium]|nr:flagellar basal body rod protein FlgC [bacterium]
MTAIDKLFSGMRIAASALKAERARVDTIAKNIANARTTSVPGTGEAYRRETLRFEPIFEKTVNGPRLGGVRVAGIQKDYSTPFQEVYDPGHPDADAKGIVRMPNVNTMQEMADLITAVRSYEANLKVQENFERMADRALRLAE